MAAQDTLIMCLIIVEICNSIVSGHRITASSGSAKISRQLAYVKRLVYRVPLCCRPMVFRGVDALTHHQGCSLLNSEVDAICECLSVKFYGPSQRCKRLSCHLPFAIVQQAFRKCRIVMYIGLSVRSFFR